MVMNSQCFCSCVNGLRAQVWSKQLSLRSSHTKPVVAKRPRRTTPQLSIHADVDSTGEKGHAVVDTRETCVLVGADLKRINGRENDLLNVMDSLDELERLAETAGMKVVGRICQSLQVPHSGTYIGSGKVKEVRSEMETLGCCTCVFDVELTPAQQRTLEDSFGGEAQGIKVLDRTALILDIFAQHAATKEGKLQVQLALYQYRLPRLTKLWTHLERQSGSGGVGLRGPGETQLEVDRRLLTTKMARIKSQIELVRAHRTRQRSSRRKLSALPVVALVGYTNAGKSTLMNKLSNSSVHVEDMLFATLDPTTRKAEFSGLKFSPEIFLTDTVGFIQKLPTTLVAAFRATLEEVVEADLLVHVMDASLPLELFEAHKKAVENVLDEIGAGNKPILEVWNKLDLCDDPEEVVSSATDHDAIAVSGITGVGLEDVGALIEERLRAVMFDVKVLIPYKRGDLVAEIHQKGSVEGEDFRTDGTEVTAKVSQDLFAKLRSFFVEDNEEGAAGAAAVQVDGISFNEDSVWDKLGKGRHDFTRKFRDQVGSS